MGLCCLGWGLLGGVVLVSCGCLLFWGVYSPKRGEGKTRYLRGRLRTKKPPRIHPPLHRKKHRTRQRPNRTQRYTISITSGNRCPPARPFRAPATHPTRNEDAPAERHNSRKPPKLYSQRNAKEEAASRPTAEAFAVRKVRTMNPPATPSRVRGCPALVKNLCGALELRALRPARHPHAISPNPRNPREPAGVAGGGEMALSARTPTA